jgi:hypothetical protein
MSAGLEIIAAGILPGSAHPVRHVNVVLMKGFEICSSVQS